VRPGESSSLRGRRPERRFYGRNGNNDPLLSKAVVSRQQIYGEYHLRRPRKKEREQSFLYKFDKQKQKPTEIKKKKRGCSLSLKSKEEEGT